MIADDRKISEPGDTAYVKIFLFAAGGLMEYREEDVKKVAGVWVFMCVLGIIKYTIELYD